MENSKQAVELGDAAFNVMDYLLDNAEYTPNTVVLHHKADVVFCYSLRQVADELQYIAKEVLERRYGETPKDLPEISQNALEEYEDELSQSFPRKARTAPTAARRQRVA